MEKKQLETKLKLVGINKISERIIENMSMKIYNSNYDILNGNELNIDWVLDQVISYCKHIEDSRRLWVDNWNNQSNLQDRQYMFKIAEEIITQSTVDGEPAVSIIGDILWEIVCYNIKRTLSLAGRGLRDIEVYLNGLRLSTTYRWLMFQIINVVILKDSGIPMSSIFSSGLNFNGRCSFRELVKSKYRYKIHILRHGVVNIQRLSTDKCSETLYPIVQTTIKGMNRDVVISGNHGILDTEINGMQIITGDNDSLALVFTVKWKNSDAGCGDNRIGCDYILLDRKYAQGMWKLEQHLDRVLTKYRQRNVIYL